MVDIRIDWLGGNCPVQAEGFVNGQPFYFRARGDRWTMEIGDPPVWSHMERYGDGPYAAGWMDEDEARAFIEKAAAKYAGER